MKLEGRVAWVTGGGSGLGRAISQCFAAEGARVVVNDLRPETAEETVKMLAGSGHLAQGGDISDSARVAEMGAQIRQECGRLDVLVNNAGVDRLPGDGMEDVLSGGASASLVTVMPDAGWTRMLEIHLNGAFFCAREAAKLMLETGSGSIINMSSIAGLAGMGPIHYATAKGGLLGFTKSLARELGPRKIRVNAICPGAIDTPMAQALPEPVLKGFIAATPLRRMGTAEEIAAAALFFASDDGAYLTGQALSPNGGIHIG
ncbi:MAG: SDR family oxidoreductase [Myxococcota bacterium]